MALLKLKCPECNAGLKSATGFTPGQTVCCPKCETYFAVEEPDEEEDAPAAKKAVKAAVTDDEDEEEEETPKKKKKRAADDDEERSYKSSPIRFIILGVLVLVMIVMGVMLYLKKRNEAAEEKRKDEAAAAEKVREEQPPPRQNTGPKKDLKRDPKVIPNPNPKPGGKGPDVGGFMTDALGDLLSGRPASPDKVPDLTRQYTAALVGSWTADLGNGVTEELTYQANGTFTAKRTGAGDATAAGKYTIVTLVGTKGLRLQLDSAGAGMRTVTVVFEGDELQHPSLQPGVTAVFRKK